MATMTTKTLNVQGFHCSGCSDNLSTALGNPDGVIRSRARFGSATVAGRCAPGTVSTLARRDPKRNAGFEAD